MIALKCETRVFILSAFSYATGASQEVKSRIYSRKIERQYRNKRRQKHQNGVAIAGFVSTEA